MGHDELDFDEQPTTEFRRGEEPRERVHDATDVSLCIDCGRATTARAWRLGNCGFWQAPVCLRHGGLVERDHFDGADVEWSGRGMDTKAERLKARRP